MVQFQFQVSRFPEDTDTGLFRVSSGQIGIVANGTKVAQFPTSTGSSGQLLSTNGAGVLSYVDAPSGATGGGSDKVIIENGTAITTRLHNRNYIWSYLQCW